MRATRRRYSSDVDLQPWSHVRTWLLCGGVGSILYGLSRDPAWVEEVYVDGWGSVLASTLAMVTAGVGFCVAEWLIAGLIVWEVLGALGAIGEAGAGRRRWANLAVGGLVHVVDLVAILGVVFYLVWGVSYARAPAVERLGWSELVGTDAADEEEVARLEAQALAAVARVNALYRSLHGKDDAGAITEPRPGLDTDAALDVGFDAAGAALGLSDAFRAARGPVKVPLASELMSWFGIGGIYMPFTGEANVNGGPPAWALVATAAHEKAHQRMVASEDEATFFGFLACVYAEEPLLRYAGWQLARRQLSWELAKRDPERARAVSERLVPGAAADQEAVYAYWRAYRGPLEQVGERVNDTYLKVNRVDGGVKAYSRAGRLITAYLRTEAGQARLKR